MGRPEDHESDTVFVSILLKILTSSCFSQFAPQARGEVAASSARQVTGKSKNSKAPEFTMFAFSQLHASSESSSA